ATNLVLHYLESVASLRPDVIRRNKPFAVWLPYTTIERLKCKLEELINSGQMVAECEEQRNLLETALLKHFQLTEYLLARDRERLQVNRPPRHEDYQCDLVAYAFAAETHIKNCEPTNYLEAISSPECDKWVVAMEEEVKDGNLGLKAIDYKARYIVRGFDQREGIDFNEIFSPVVRHTSIRVLLSIVALQDLELEQVDVKTTFLHGHLEEEIYVEQPEAVEPFEEPLILSVEDRVGLIRMMFLEGVCFRYSMWIEDEKALATIQLFLTREVLREVIHETNATGLWLKLQSLYMTKSLANKLRLKDRLYTFRMKPGTSVQDHLDEFNTILIDLENLDKSCYMANRETLSFDDVKSALLSKQKYDDDVEPESGERLVARGRSSDRAIAKGDPDGDVYLAIDTEKSRDELIVDAGCTFYMIPHRSLFTTYESFNGGNVYMGNNSICPIIRLGNIQVKMYDGVVRTITGVRHVPDLKKNLISLSTLEANGCKYSGEGRVMKIFKGALVLMKAILSGGLYVLQGTVVYGTAGVATSKASLDDSKLWHYCLGHMGEKGMKNRAKKGLIKVSCNLEFCEHCVFGKQKRVSFSPGIHRTRDALDYIHSIYGSNLLLRLEEYGIARHHTLVRTPQQNDVTERMNMTIIEKVRCMLSHANSDKDFWVKVATTATYLITRSPHRSLDGNIPEIPWSDNSVDYSDLRGKVEFEFDVENSTHIQPPFNDEHIETQDDGNMPTSPQSQPQTEYLLARDRERLQVNRPPRHEDYQCDLVAYAFAAETHIKNCEPTNYLEAISSPECDKWVVAMEEEVKDGNLGLKAIDYKARYIVRGFDQREGIDFNEIFSPVVRHTSIRVLLSIVALQDLELEQVDVKTTFLHGHLEEEIYVEQPEGFKVPGKEDHVYDESIYLRKFPDASFLYLVLYVDDMLIVAPNKDQIRELKDQLSIKFDMKDLGAAKSILGIKIQRDREMGKLTLSQTDYISKVLKKFNMSSCKPVPTPLAPHFKLSSHECPKSEEDKICLVFYIRVR
nr:retrovirus-related Pol polyprotein from transposon TNT 1-94 [Tanacetum cinerariifolium]